MKLTEKLISENHRDEFSASSGKPSISPSPLRLTSMHFSDVIPASEKKKKSNPTRQCSRDCAPVIEIPEISQFLGVSSQKYYFSLETSSISSFTLNGIASSSQPIGEGEPMTSQVSEECRS
ncbi:hypothetical protein TNCV_1136151 [Trichonephila clavipes]|nr:hypothetical protein TNCV_1136151 [Trichonephila clavipes]